MSTLAAQFTDPQALEHLVTQLLLGIGEDPEREGLRETPQRVVRSWQELFAGYQQRPEEVLKVFEDGACDEMVVLKNIEFYSVCEHHWLPFWGTIHIGYIPDKRVVGVSKLARLVEIFSRRLQIQERLTTQIAEALFQALRPLGVMVVCQARHFCMTARGIKKQRSQMVTSANCGVFREDEKARHEFLHLIGRE
jgi:GTP cyclohydrolase IA